jgi:starvation-inducible DNA-binding protein
LHAPRNAPSSNIRGQSVEILNWHLAAAIDLRSQIKQASWNVRGPNFIALRELFEEVAGRVERYSDTIASRAAALGGTAHGTIATASKRSFLAPYVLGIANEQLHLLALSSAMAAFGRSVREAIQKTSSIGDAGTAGVFTEIGLGIDLELWLVEAHSPPDTRTATHSAIAMVRS